MLGVLLFCVACCSYLWWRWQLQEKRIRELKLPPMFPGALPIIGHAHILISDTERLWQNIQYLADDCTKQGGITYATVGGQIYYAITDPEDGLTVANTCLQKHFAYDFGKPWMGEGLVVGSGPTWKRHRKLLNPAYSLQVLYGYLGVFNSQARRLVSHLSSEVDKGPFDHIVYLKQIALETICLSAFGVNNTEEDRVFNQKYMKAVDQILHIMTQRFQKFWLQSDFLYMLFGHKRKENEMIKVLNAMSNMVIQRKREKLKTNKSEFYKDDVDSTPGLKHRALMDLLIELAEDNTFTDKEIREEVDTAIVAGYDTTSFLLACILMFLGSYPQVQDRLYKELQEVFGDTDRDVEKEDLAKLVYTEAIIKETLRLYPTGPVTLRYIDRDVKLKNYTLRAGSNCVVLSYGINRHPVWGHDAHEFRPERWLDPATLPENLNIYAGFSLGKRSCMGKTFAMLSMKTSLSHIMRRYKVSADITQLKLKMEFLLKAVSGHRISIVERD